MVATNGRTRSRHRIRPGMPGPVAEHRPKIMAAAISGVIVLATGLVLTSQGRDIATAMQRFLLYYAGVFALLTLTGSVVAGLVATDRVFLTPGRRVLAQAVHRAISFGALSFLVIHVVTEILAQRVHVLDGVVPFMSPFRRFYIGLGTLASDLIVLLVATSIVRKRFTGHDGAWRWRAVHYMAYLCFVSGIAHGLMAGRSAKPYVYWSYGVAIGLVALGVLSRILATSLRPKENVSGPPGRRDGAAGHAAPLQAAAAMSLAQAQLGGSARLMPAGAFAGAGSMSSGFGSSGEFLPLGAPPYGDGVAPYMSRTLAALPAPAPYEPGYLGPPRYQGAPRGATGPQPWLGTGPQPRMGTGPQPRMGTGPQPRMGTGPQPRLGTGPLPAFGPGVGPGPVPGPGPAPRGATGPMPRAGTGPMPRAATGPMPRAATGPMPAMGDGGPLPPRNGTGPMPRSGTGPMPRAATGPMPWLPAGPPPGAEPGYGPDDRPREQPWHPGPFHRGGDQWR